MRNPPIDANARLTLAPGAAQRAAAVVSHVSSDWVTRRVQRHIADLERSNYTEPTSGPSAFGTNEDGEDTKGAGAASVLEDQGASFWRREVRAKVTQG